VSDQNTAALLVDWENLTGAIVGRGKSIDRKLVDDLWSFAHRKAGGQLKYAHMAAAKFDPSISAAMSDRLIKPETVRSTKEQADIALTVLAMDYLYDGCKMFILVTGDQDFIPLIARLHRDGCAVTVVYGDANRLGHELRVALRTPGIESVDITEVSALQDRPQHAGPRAFVGLVEILRQGTLLGGKDFNGRTQQLVKWGILPTEDESGYWELVQSLCLQTTRRDAAIRIDGEWRPKNSNRTFVNLARDRVNDLVALDHLIRNLAARPNGVRLENLRSGPLRFDDGRKIESLLDALIGVHLARKEADGSFACLDPDRADGYLEYLWRVYAGVQAECFRRGERTMPYNSLEPSLSSRGVGQGKGTDQRSPARVRSAANYARAFGIIDAVAENGTRRVVVNPSNPVAQMMDTSYASFYAAFSDRLNIALDEQSVLDELEERDRGRVDPVFGWDLRDRHRILRILSQSRLINRRDSHVTVLESAWGSSR
jgi:uncharacterized LabA/DUF88 family protein